MRKVDELIRRFLAQKLAGSRLERGLDCPSEGRLCEYLYNLLPKEESQNIGHHVARCLYCLEQLDQAQRASKVAEWEGMPGPSAEAISKAKDAASRPVLRGLGRGLEEGAPLVCRRCGSPNSAQSRYCSQCGSPLGALGRQQTILGRSLTGLKKARWLIGSLVAFTLSFLFPRFFLQFLALAVILGAKWVFDTATTRTLIMIYDAWRKRGKGEPGEILRRLKERIEKRDRP